MYLICIAHLLLGFEAGSNIFRLAAMLEGPHLSSNAIDFYYRMYSFYFEIKNSRFKLNKALKNQFSATYRFTS